MEANLVAKSLIIINAPISKVWDAFVNPEIIKNYMFGTTVVSDWREGGPIVWKGVWEGKPYEDKGTILKIVPGKLLQYSHFSPLSNTADIPENYHTVSIELSVEGYQTQVWLSQDNNKSVAERDHSQKMWDDMFERLKKVLEKKSWEQ